MYGDLGGRRHKNKIEVASPIHPYPEYLEKWCYWKRATKYKLTKKGVKEEILFWNWGFSSRKGVIYVIYQISDSRDRQKRTSEILGVKIGIFSW